MTSQGREWQRFQHGSDWVRANFHMHTRADKEFKHDKDGNGYLGKYVEALKAASIAIGVITNHNKFDFDEFVSDRNRCPTSRASSSSGLASSWVDATCTVRR